MAIKKKKEMHRIVTPIGRLSYPYLVEPDNSSRFKDGKYKTDLLIPKSVMKLEGKAFKQMVLDVGRFFFDDDSLGFEDFNHPFKDGDLIEDAPEHVKGHIIIRAKSNYPISIFGPDAQEMSAADAEKIKGGDYAKLIVNVYAYSQQEGGVTLGLQGIQFVKPGKALGGASIGIQEMLEEIEVTVEDLPEDEEEEEKPKKKALAKKKVVEEEEEEEEKPKKKASSKKVEDEEDDLDF